MPIVPAAVNPTAKLVILVLLAIFFVTLVASILLATGLLGGVRENGELSDGLEKVYGLCERLCLMSLSGIVGFASGKAVGK